MAVRQRDTADTNGDTPTGAVGPEGDPGTIKRPKKFELVARALEEGVPFRDLNGLIEIASWAEPPKTDHHEQYATYYTDVHTKFEESDDGCKVWVFGNIRGAVYLNSDATTLQIKFDPAKINFDWAPAAKILYATQALQQDVDLWVRQKGEHATVMQRVAALASRVLSAVAAEARLHATSGRRTKPTGEFLAAIDAAKDDLRGVEKEVDDAAARSSLILYAQGMIWGIGIMVVVAAVIAGVFYWHDVRFDKEIALITGALGAVVSVLQRMSAGKLKIDYRTAGDMVRSFGMVRPLLGATFGMVTFALIEGGFLPWVNPPNDLGTYAAFLAVLGFLSGFNERFAQDMLGRATEAFQPPTLGSAQPV